MQITEQFTQSKSGRAEDCEDIIIADRDFVAVIDGTTSKKDEVIAGKRSGGFAAACIAESVTAVDLSLCAYDIICKISSALRKKAAAAGYTDTPCGSLVMYNARSAKLISYGDCPFMINGRLYSNEKKIDVRLAAKRADCIKRLIKSGVSEREIMTADPGRDYIMSDLVEQYKYANRRGEFGYPVVNGDVPVADFVKIHAIAPGSEIVLASDGYPFVKSTLAASESKLAYLLKHDPLLIDLYKSTKGLTAGNISYDDRSYIRFTV